MTSTLKMNDLPLSILISINDYNSNTEQLKISKSILKFYNLIDLDSKQLAPQLKERIESQTRFIIQHFNCIRFKQISQQVKQKTLFETKIKIPSFSFILITNNSAAQSTNKHFSEYDNLDNEWSYHHKVELNDPNGKPLARQSFYKLNNHLNTLPLLFSRSNWHSPFINSLKSQNSTIKYIIRLNINCKNFEMMLFFYRLLFNKCSNHSKKDFSLFVLKKTLSDNSEFEYQLSLKQHDQGTVCIEENSKQQASLVYKIDNRATFEHVCSLLSGYLTEQIKDKVYLVQDPDGNKIYLVDCVSINISLFNSIGLVEKYFTFNIWAKNVLNTNSSSSSFNSVDSGNYSTLSSSSSCRSAPSTRLAKSIKEYQEFMKHYKKLHKLISKEQLALENEEAKIKYGVKDLIKRFSHQPDGTISTSSQNLADDNELKILMKNATPNPISYLSKEVNVDNYLKRTMRSKSVMAEPLSSTSISSSSLSSISSMSSDSINIKLNQFDRKKSKSVTFLDSNKIKFRKKDPVKRASIEPRRSKSTVPFSDFENYYLTADVDNENEYYSLNDNNNNLKLNYLSNEFNLLNASVHKPVMGPQAKPHVGVTTETRY